MSTSYNYLRPPVTALRLVERKPHDLLTVWESGANAGTLTLSAGTGRRIALMLAEDEDDARCPMRTLGGPNGAIMVVENVRGLDPGLQLISETGLPFTVAEIRAMAREGREP